MKSNEPDPPDPNSKTHSDRTRLIRLLATLLARRWWRDEIRKRDGESASRDRLDRKAEDP